LDGGSWSEPATILTGLSDEPLQLASNVDGLGRLFLAWVDGKTGELLFSWASSDRAFRASEWKEPQYIPSKSKVNSSPDILVDGSGMLLVAYAVPINEQRGIYFVESSDAGNSWSQPYKIFDAASAGWDVVDQPKICLTGDGRLQALFNKYSLLGDGRQAQGLYYTQSANGGTTWSEPEVVTEHAVLWSDIACSDQQNVHRIWQEENESYYASLDQVSQDGGQTWNDPIYITSLSEKPTSGKLTSSENGQIYFITIVEDDNLVMQEWGWDGAAWKLLDSKELLLKGKSTPLAITAGITTKGSLGVLVSAQNQEDPEATLKHEIIVLSRSLELPKNDQPTTPAIISTPAAVATQSDLLNSYPSPVDTPSLVNSGDSPLRKINKNTWGLLFIGGLVVLFFIVFRPRKAKEHNAEKTRPMKQ
jgi:hypothetical protein